MNLLDLYFNLYALQSPVIKFVPNPAELMFYLTTQWPQFDVSVKICTQYNTLQPEITPEMAAF